LARSREREHGLRMVQAAIADYRREFGEPER